jgi:hypothetical protein
MDEGEISIRVEGSSTEDPYRYTQSHTHRHQSLVSVHHCVGFGSFCLRILPYMILVSSYNPPHQHHLTR